MNCGDLLLNEIGMVGEVWVFSMIFECVYCILFWFFVYVKERIRGVKSVIMNWKWIIFYYLIGILCVD